MLKIIFKNKKNIILIYFKIKKYFEKKPLLHSQTSLFSNILLPYSQTSFYSIGSCNSF